MDQARPIVDFLKENPKYLRLSSVDTPKWKDRYGYENNGYKLPDVDLCVTSLYAYSDKVVQINYMNPKKSSAYAIVPNDFLASILPADKFAEMEAKYGLERERVELRSKLSFGGGSCGSDPEIFVEDKKGQLIPAFKFLGSKAKPYVVKKFQHWNPNNCYWDGFQAEFDTMPSSCFSGQADSIHFGLQGVLEAARKHDKDAKLSFRPVFDIPPDMLAEGKPEHVNFGCMPSLNAYGMQGLQLPGHEVSFRPAGGHMHFGWSYLKPEEAIKIVKSMDAILGVACVSMFAKFDDPRRRQLYGLAGEYRLPKHGIEYRVLSNAWLIHPLIAHIVFDLGRTAAMVGLKDMMNKWDCSEQETIRIINEHDVEAARKVLAKNEQFLKRLIEIKYYQWWSGGTDLDVPTAANYVYNIIMNGLESVIADPTDIESNWNLLGAKTKIEVDAKKLKAGDIINQTMDGEWRMHSDGPGKNVMFVFKYGLENKKV